MFLIPFTLSLASALEPATYVLEAPANVWDLAVQDLDGDGQGDVVLLTCDEATDPLSKWIEVFLGGDSAGYPRNPSFSLGLDPSISTVFFAEVDGQAPRELVAANSRGATVYRCTGDTFESVSETRFPSLLPENGREPIFSRHMAEDLDGDGLDEWLIPVAGGIEVRDAGGLRATLPCDVTSEIRIDQNTFIFHRLPSWHAFSLEGTPQKGVAFLSDEFADFAHGPDWAERKRFKIPVSVDEKWDARTEMADINDDGFPDLTVTQTKGTVNLESLTQVYVASEAFTYPEEPTASFSGKRSITSPKMKDVNGDGMLDVVIINVSLGVRNIINFFLRGKVAVQIEVFTFDGEEFGTKPAYAASLSLDAPEGRERVAYTMGDFNGDGRIDVGYGRGGNTFVVHTGESGRLVSSRPWVKLEIPSFGLARPYDLNGNEAEDILIHHPAGKNAKRVEAIVF